MVKMTISFNSCNCMFGTWWLSISKGVRSVPDKLAWCFLTSCRSRLLSCSSCFCLRHTIYCSYHICVLLLCVVLLLLVSSTAAVRFLASSGELFVILLPPPNPAALSATHPPSPHLIFFPFLDVQGCGVSGCGVSKY